MHRRFWCILALPAVLIALTGCENPPAGAEGAGGDPGRVYTSKEIVAAHARSLRRIETVWRESVAIVDAHERRRTGVGVILASDGREALLLTSRRQVDPRYQRSGVARTSDVTFRVSAPGQAGPPQFARLAAVFMSGGDLALLVIDAPADVGPFALPIASTDTLGAGEAVAVVTAGSGKSFDVADGKVRRRWVGAGAAAELLDVALTKGGAADAGIVFSLRGAQLAGMAPTGRGDAGAVSAICAGRLANPDLWDHLTSEHTTRRLLAMLR